MNILLESFEGAFLALEMVWRIYQFVWFLVFPPILYFLFKLIWMDHVQNKFAATIEYTLLEIVPPRDIEKSPRLMESIYSGLAGVHKSINAVEEFIQGQFIHSFSLEISSNEGNVHFYIRTPKNFRNLVEAHFYAQYPDIELIEAVDYTNEIPKLVPNRQWDLWGTDFELAADDAMPIKTYRFFEETITGTMIDPLGSLIETIGKLGPGQKIWFQQIITPLSVKWREAGRDLADKLAGRAAKKKGGFISRLFSDLWDIFKNVPNAILGQITLTSAVEEKKQETPLTARLTPGEMQVLEALEGNMGKDAYAVKMRFLYLGKKENFDRSNISAFIGGIKQFADLNLNAFKPNEGSKTYANYIFEEQRLRYRQRKIFRRYKTRDPAGVRFVLTTEELATTFHMPDMSVKAPALRRVDARRGGAPSNLPVG